MRNVRLKASDRDREHSRLLTRRSFVLGSLSVGVVVGAEVGGDGVEPREWLELPKPVCSGGMPLMQALQARATVRDYGVRPLELQVISNLLWAAFGVNRPDTGQRTAPSAMDNREIDVWLFSAEGVFRFDAEKHRLEVWGREDLRWLTGGQDYVKVAPVTLLYVADPQRQRRVSPPEREFYAAADTGFIAQNVYLYCASEGLVSVVHVVPDHSRLKERLGMPPDRRVVLGQCVGYPV